MRRECQEERCGRVWFPPSEEGSQRHGPLKNPLTRMRCKWGGGGGWRGEGTVKQGDPEQPTVQQRGASIRDRGLLLRHADGIHSGMESALPSVCFWCIKWFEWKMVYYNSVAGWIMYLQPITCLSSSFRCPPPALVHRWALAMANLSYQPNCLRVLPHVCASACRCS